MALIISPQTEAKLNGKHGVTRLEVEQCFSNRTGQLLEDAREQHRTDPPTWWFIAPTNKGRLLKVCFVARDGNLYLRTAYPPNDNELCLYVTKGQPDDFE